MNEAPFVFGSIKSTRLLLPSSNASGRRKVTRPSLMQAGKGFCLTVALSSCFIFAIHFELILPIGQTLCSLTALS